MLEELRSEEEHITEVKEKGRQLWSTPSTTTFDKGRN